MAHASVIAAASRLKSWRENPALFAWENFRFEPDAWQKDALDALGGGYQSVRRVGMKACTGPGKTAVLAIAGWHRLSCFGRKNEYPKGAALSETKENLKANLWPEMATWQKRSEFLSSQFTWGKERISNNDHPENWFLDARSFARNADDKAIGTSLSGLHCPFPFVLLDECGEMSPVVGKRASQIFTGSPVDAAVIAAGNPTSISGLLYEICTHLREQWKIITITADPDDPKRTPRVDINLAREEIRLNGRDNPWVMATILGLFPPCGFNALLGVEDIEAAMKRHYAIDAYDFAPKIIGVDVAREGDDRSIFAPRQGLVGFKPKVFRNARSHILGTSLAQSEDKWGADGVIVDGTGGFGSGVIDFGANMGRTWFDCQFAGAAPNPKFKNMRAYILWQLAEWVKNGGALPYIPEMIREIPAITYTYVGDQILIKPKELIKKEIGASPDYTDAYATTFAYPIAKKIIVPENLRSEGGRGEYNPVARAEDLMKRTGGRGDYNIFGRS